MATDSTPTPLQWVLVAGPFLAISLSAIFGLRRQAGGQWLRWNNVGPLPWTPMDMVGLAALILASLALLYPLTPVICLLGAIFVGRSHQHDPILEWKLWPIRIPWHEPLVLYAAVLLPVAMAAGISFWVCWQLGITNIMQEPVREILTTTDPYRLLFFLIAAVVIAPLWEEIVFRGIIYSWIKTKFGQPLALGISSVLFGAIHFHAPAILPLIVLGLCLALAYERTGSLWSAIGLHALFNAGTAVNLLLVRFYDAPQ